MIMAIALTNRLGTKAVILLTLAEERLSYLLKGPYPTWMNNSGLDPS
jgi:hypothetical protein